MVNTLSTPPVKTDLEVETNQTKHEAIDILQSPNNLLKCDCAAEKAIQAAQHTDLDEVGKRAVRSALDLGMSEGILAERSEFVALFDTEDKEIGVQAFLERKDAEWKGS